MIEYWVWLSLRKRVGARGISELLQAFGTPENIYRADKEQLLHTPGVSQAMLPSLLDKELASANRVLEDCYSRQIRILTMFEEDYPPVLRAIGDPPAVLYLRGSLPETENRAVIGIVGSRKASAYGLSVAERMGYALHAGGCTVVSGMARGVDTAAMRGALKAGDRVIAVLGCGADVVYPKENRALYEEICARGCVISEYCPGTPPLAENFPPRNRIISGLSDGVLVVEASAHSGSLITAERALEQNRDVFAVPGNLGLSTCEGSNRLLKDGAELVQSAQDILQVYSDRYPDTVSFPEVQPTERTSQKTIDLSNTINYIDLNENPDHLPENAVTLLRALGSASMDMDELTDASGLPAGTVRSMTTLLQVKEYLQRSGGNRFSRKR